MPDPTNVHAAMTIRLRFKYKDPESKHLISALKKLQSASTTPTTEVDIFKSFVDGAVDKAQRILRAEWLKVKRGELTYRLITILVSRFIVGEILFCSGLQLTHNTRRRNRMFKEMA